MRDIILNAKRYSIADKEIEFLNKVLKERGRQIAMWGEKQEGANYPTILGEEFGEICKAYNENDIGILEELVQTATVCMAWYEVIKEVEGGK